MTKLMEWLFGVSLFLAVWISIVFEYIQGIPANYRRIALPMPIIFVGLFGIYSVFVILYRVATFNNCDEAEKELRRQTVEARKDLRSKGFVFKNVS